MSTSLASQHTASEKHADKGPHATLRRTTLIVIPLCVVFVLLGWLQMRDLDNGIVETYARQQDSYVGIVLNEINLNEDRSTDEIISDILGTLHNSASSYWAFSRGQTMLYVKDVTETNRYKGVSANTYFDSTEAEEFLDSLTEDQVVHQRILLEGENYLASGIQFSYGGSDYRLCLLTNINVLLGNNEYMGARARMGTLWTCEIAVFCAGMLFTANNVDRRRRERDNERAQVALLNERLSLSSERVRRMGLYDAREGAWNSGLVVRFARKLRARSVEGGAVVRVGCNTPEETFALLERCGKALGDGVLCFHNTGELEVTLLFAHGTPHDAEAAVEPLLQGGAHVVAAQSLDDVLANADKSGEDSHDED